MSGFVSKISKLRALLEEKALDALVLRRNPNLAWLIGGRVHVPTTLDLACFDLILTREKVIAVTNSIEAPRLIAEELPNEVEVLAIDWWESRDGKLPIGERVGSDQPGAGRVDLAIEIEILRQSLEAEDIARFEKVCVDSATALGKALKESNSTDREIDVSARISNLLWQQNLELVFMGVAGIDRIHRFRHALPTENVVGDRIVASICARRKGLIASVTRIISFPKDQVLGYEGILHVESEMLDQTKVGNRFSEPVEAAIAAYPKYGFDLNEWQRHHQGGPTGFMPRDWPANRDSARLIQESQPIAWNPTGNGWKVEDTLLATSNGVRILTIDPDWPMVGISGRQRPAVLKK